jgi:hypothetical protein
MKRALVFLAVYTASLALLVVIVVVVLVVYIAVGQATGILFSFTPSSVAALLLIMLFPGVFSSWLTRKLLRSTAPPLIRAALINLSSTC